MPLGYSISSKLRIYQFQRVLLRPREKLRLLRGLLERGKLRASPLPCGASFRLSHKVQHDGVRRQVVDTRARTRPVGLHIAALLSPVRMKNELLDAPIQQFSDVKHIVDSGLPNVSYVGTLAK